MRKARRASGQLPVQWEDLIILRKTHRGVGAYNIYSRTIRSRKDLALPDTLVHEGVHAVGRTLSSDPRRTLLVPGRAGSRLAVLRANIEAERLLREAARRVKTGHRGGNGIASGFSKPVWRDYETRRHGRTRPGVAIIDTPTEEYATVNAGNYLRLRLQFELLGLADGSDWTLRLAAGTPAVDQVDQVDATGAGHRRGS